MQLIQAILEPDADGSLHLPLPPELAHGPIRVEAKLESADIQPLRAKAGLWKDLPGEFWMAPDFDAPMDDFKEYME